MSNILTLVRLACLLACCSLYSSVVAADLFSSGNEPVVEGELPLNEQAELYKQFFSAKDKKAKSSSAKIEFAAELKMAAEEEKFKGLRRQLLIRIDELCDGQRKLEAHQLQLFAFIERNKHKDPNRSDNLKHIELLEQLLKKAPRDERNAVMQEITTLWNTNAKLAIKNKKYDLAQDDYKTLSSLLKKTGDKDGAAMAKRLVDYIDDYIDEKEKVESLLTKEEKSTKDHQSIGHFAIREQDWATAEKHLTKAGETMLSKVAAIAALEKPDNDQLGQCAVAINTVLNDRDYRKETFIRRSLLAYGLHIKSVLDQEKEQLSETMKIKYTLVSESWSEEYEKIGPDPLKGFEVAPTGASVDEARLIRMGWVAIFDHKNLIGFHDLFTPTPEANAKVINGCMVLTIRGGNLSLSRFPSIEHYQSIKVRFRITEGSVNGGIEVREDYDRQKAARVIIRRENAAFSNEYSNEFGEQPLKDNDWNDITISWDGKVVKATLNGQSFKDAKGIFSVNNMRMSVGSRESAKVHIQSILALPKKK